jgi:hypothetical protein
MSKKIILTLFVGILVFAFSESAFAQKKSTAKKAEEVTVAEKMKSPEKYNPKPQAATSKLSKNPIRPAKTKAEEIKDLKIIIKRLEAKEDKLPYEVKRLTRLKKELAEKAK